MNVSAETASSAPEGRTNLDSEFVPDDLIEIEALGETEDFQLRAARRAQLEDADTLRRVRAL